MTSMTIDEMLRRFGEDVECNWDSDCWHYVARLKASRAAVGLVFPDREHPADSTRARFVPIEMIDLYIEEDGNE